MTLGEKIQKLRQEKNLSQKELAIKINKSTADVAVWESNEAVPSISDIAKLSAIFDVTTDALIMDSKVSDDGESHSSINGIIVEKDSKSARKQTNKKKRKKIYIFLILICVLVLVVIGLLANSMFSPFSKNITAIEKATASVVKIICYDHEGNESATGSGFIAFDNQTVITNYHVMEEAYTCKVSTDEDKTYEVESILAYSKEQDIAIIKLTESTGLKVLELGSSDKIKKGETVTAIGSPLGIKNTVSQGVLSGRLMEDNMDVLQFTAAISSGSSGGALFDERGKVIGVTYASYIDGQNLNLAIPIEIVRDLMKSKTSNAAKKVSKIYIEAHPYVQYLNKFSSAIDVTFEELKDSPLAYKGKLVKIDTYISSMNQKQYPEFTSVSYYFSNQENISGNYEYDESLTAESGISIPYKRVPVMPTGRIFNIDDIVYADPTIEVGDNVIIIGTFDYARVGEVDDVYGIASKVEYGSIDVEMIYKK